MKENILTPMVLSAVDTITMLTTMIIKSSLQANYYLALVVSRSMHQSSTHILIMKGALVLISIHIMKRTSTSGQQSFT